VTRFFAFVVLVQAALAQPVERVIIKTSKPYQSAIAAVQSRGGKVTHTFQYVDAIAAEMPQSALAAVRAALGANSVQKDLVISLPAADPVRGKTIVRGAGSALRSQNVNSLSVQQVSTLAAKPAAYAFNNSILGVAPLHAAGNAGQGVVVAVLDSGLRPGFPHIDGSVIGGEDFVGDGKWSDAGNSGHGTFVAGMIAAHAVFLVPSATTFVNALNAYAPGAAFPSGIAGLHAVPMIGSAPAASLYVMRVLAPSGSGSVSGVMRAMERTIELRKSGLNIRVANMSLGGTTLVPGLDLVDQLVDRMTEAGIVTVAAAGNTGPATLTNASPGSALNAITVGAAADAPHARVLFELLTNFPGFGGLYIPANHTQVANFSSRGPNADGRSDPDVLANGFGNFGQGLGLTPLDLNLGSGTSFASPSVAGVAAVLRQMFPGATARQVRNAILMSATPALIPGATALDQGRGLVNAAAAAALLQAGKAPDAAAAPAKPVSSLKVNVEKAGLDVRNGFVNETLAGLKPGERRDIVYRVHPNTRQILIGILNFTAGAVQNQIVGDDLLVAVHSPKTSAIGASGDYLAYQFMRNGTLVVNDPEPGLLRVSVNGDSTNAGNVSASVAISSLTHPIPQFTKQDKVQTNDLTIVPFAVPSGVSEVDVRLSWRDDWGAFPPADLDVTVISPDGLPNFAGATLRNPEAVKIAQPKAGQWLAVVYAFDIPSGDDKYELRIALDGKVVKK
jgi:serine protease AprX